MGTSDDLQKKGGHLLNELKAQVVNALASDPSGRPQGSGLGNSEIERLAGLQIPLDRPATKETGTLAYMDYCAGSCSRRDC